MHGNIGVLYRNLDRLWFSHSLFIIACQSFIRKRLGRCCMYLATHSARSKPVLWSGTHNSIRGKLSSWLYVVFSCDSLASDRPPSVRLLIPPVPRGSLGFQLGDVPTLLFKCAEFFSDPRAVFIGDLALKKDLVAFNFTVNSCLPGK